MNDFLFKETFTHKDNRKQLKTLLELFLELPKDYLQDKVLDVRMRSQFVEILPSPLMMPA